MARTMDVHMVVEPDWSNKSYCPPEKLSDYDFSYNSAVTHPIKMAATKNTLYDFHTGKVIATIVDGYEFYWGHYHPHVRHKTGG